MPFTEEEWTKHLEENQVRRAQHPDDPRPLYNLGNLYHWKGDLPEAEEFFEVGYDRAEGELASQAAFNLGNTLHKLGRLPEARDAYVAALRLDPQNEDAKLNLELTQMMMDQMEQAPDSTCRQQGGEQDSNRRDSEQSQQDTSPQGEDSEEQQQEQQTQADQQEQQSNQEESQREPGEQAEEDQQDEEQQGQQQAPPEPREQPPGRDQETARPDSLMDATELQLMQLLKGLEAAERELLEQRFQARSRSETVEKDW